MENEKVEALRAKIHKYQKLHQHYVDKTVPYVTYRWIGFTVLLLVFMCRILFAQGWYIICYGLGIYLLNMFLGFLTPKFDPSLEQDLQNEDMEEGLPVSQSEEFRPFIRRVPEFKFWLNATRGVAVSIVLAFIPWFDIPVFWPILVFYFVVLFALTMRRQIQHMIRYRYIPFDIGKKKFSKK